MTLAPQAPGSTPENLDDALRAVRAQGLRASSARRVLLAALFAAGRPVTAEAIARGVDGRVPPSDVGSVYRNLDALVHAGIVRRLTPGYGAALFVVAPAAGAGYVACERCHDLKLADPSALAAVCGVVRATLGYEVSFAHVPLVGLCANCSGSAT